jgi:hypothetical protein
MKIKVLPIPRYYKSNDFFNEQHEEERKKYGEKYNGSLIGREG